MRAKSTTKSMILLTASFLALMLQACSRSECKDYRDHVENAETREMLSRWADEKIFSATFLEDQFQQGGMDGPGPGPGNLNSRIAASLLPDKIADYNIRFIGADSARPSMILLGRRKYQGILVSRGKFEDDLARTRMSRDRLETVMGRVGLLCLKPFD